MNHELFSSSGHVQACDDFHRLFENDFTVGCSESIYGPDGGLYLPSNQAKSPVDYTSLLDQGSSESPDHLYKDFNFTSHYPGLGIGHVSGYSKPSSSSYIPSNIVIQETPIEASTDTGTSPRSAISDPTRRTRSGRVIRSNTPHSVNSKVSKTSSSSTPILKSTRKRATNTKAPKIDKPLSELTKHMIDVPVRDMDAWVHRSEEERYKEVEKKNGYVSRPMNSFMLYRSAYAERTKQWCLQNNHQVVSAVSGESWPMEPPEIREKYNELARIERDNHAQAHPDYKFSPSKGGAVKRKLDFSSDDEHGRASDDDGEWKPTTGRTKAPRATGSSLKKEGSQSKTMRPFRRSNELKYITVPASTWEVPKARQQVFWEPAHVGPYYHDNTSPWPSAPMSGLENVESSPFDFSSTQVASIPYELPGSYDNSAWTEELDSLPFGHHIDPELSEFDYSTHFNDELSTLYANGQNGIQPSQFHDWVESVQYA